MARDEGLRRLFAASQLIKARPAGKETSGVDL